EANAGIDRPHEGDQLLVDDGDDLLVGVDGAEDLLPDGLLLDALDEVLGDLVVDVGVEQGLADLLEALAHVGFGEPAAPTELFEGLAEAALDAFEHGERPKSRRVCGAAGPAPRRGGETANYRGCPGPTQRHPSTSSRKSTRVRLT